MAMDHDGNLWISTYQSVNKYNSFSDNFIRYKHDPGDSGTLSSERINCIYTDKSGTLWVGTGNQGGLDMYLSEEDKFKAYSRNSGDTSWRVPNILSLLEDNKGNFWVGTDAGLFQFDRGNGRFQRVEVNQKFLGKSIPPVCKTLHEDFDGTVITGTPHGFLIFDTIHGELIPFEGLYLENLNMRWLDYLPVLDDPDYSHWLLIAYVLYKYDKKTGDILNISPDPGNPSSIYGKALKSIYRDDSGIFWIPGEFGVNIMNPMQYQIGCKPGVEENGDYATSFFEDENERLWIGSSALTSWDRNMKHLHSYHHFTQDFSKTNFSGNFWSICEDREGNIWAGNDNNGLYVLKNGSDDLAKCNFANSNPTFIYDIIEDSKGILWVGTNLGLFSRKPLDLPSTQFYNSADWGPLIETTILSVFEDRSGTLWIGTNVKGLFSQPPEFRGTTNFLHYCHDQDDRNSLSNNWVWSVYEDLNGNLWIATEFGLNKFLKEDKSFIRYLNEADPGSNFIYDLTGDDNGVLWMTTESGLIRFDPSNEAVGGGVHYYHPGIVKFMNNSVVGNKLSTGDTWSGAGVGCYFAEDKSIFKNNTFTGNAGPIYSTYPQLIGFGSGGGLIIFEAGDNEAVVDGNIFQSDSAKFGGGVSIKHSFNLEVSNNLFRDCYAYSGGGMDIVNTGVAGNTTISPQFANNTFYNNYTLTNGYGGALFIRCEINLPPVTFNNIFFGNQSPNGNDLFLINNADTVLVAYSNIDPVNIAATNSPWVEYGNINLTPGFIDDSCHIDNSSPCLNAGADSILFEGTWYDCPVEDFDGDERPFPSLYCDPVPDIGADEAEIDCAGIAPLAQNSSANWRIDIQNYPNPFTYQTIVVFNIPEEQLISLIVYDLMGREITTLVSGRLEKGEHTITFKASDLPGGIYLLRLVWNCEPGTANCERGTVTRKIMVTK
jgi:ligand-binding sensor domain-containing protein